MKRNRLQFSTHGQDSSGFTLIELVFVLAIIGIVMAVIAPDFRGFISGQSAKNTANKLVALARHARAQSIADGCVYRLNVDTAKGEFWVDVQNGPVDFKALGTDFGQHIKFPEGMKARWVVENADTPLPVEGGGQVTQVGAPGQGTQALKSAQAVLFYPDGRCETTVLKLSGPGAEEFTLGAPTETEIWRVAPANEVKP